VCELWPCLMAILPMGGRLGVLSSQITSPLNGPVIFLKSRYVEVFESASSVGSELKAHSGLRRIEM